jgi:hypothetical protein
MKKFKLKNNFIAKINDSKILELPKYTSQLMNLANQNAGGTRPRVVGQLSELFPEYLNTTSDPSIEEWDQWYSERYPNAINEAVAKIINQIDNLKKALPLITDEMIKDWVTDLVVYKTFNGLYFQKAILSKIAEEENTTYRLANPHEEAEGIDGYIGNIPISIKPDTYNIMDRLPEHIDVKIITYSKKKDGISVNYSL